MFHGIKPEGSELIKTFVLSIHSTFQDFAKKLPENNEEKTRFLERFCKPQTINLFVLDEADESSF